MRPAAHLSVIHALQAQIRSLQGGNVRRQEVLPFGIDELDRRLPQGGLLLGALHEVAGGGGGALDGAAAALFAAGIAARTGGKVLWCLARPDLFAPAGAVGIAIRRWRRQAIAAATSC